MKIVTTPYLQTKNFQTFINFDGFQQRRNTIITKGIEAKLRRKIKNSASIHGEKSIVTALLQSYGNARLSVALH